MLIFLDTEFADFADREPISIGMVSEDGQHVFYVELRDFDRDRCSAFVRSNVWPLLGQTDGAMVKKIDLPDRLRTWFATLPRKVTIACDSEFDRDVLGAVMGGQWPGNLAGWFDLRPLIDTTVFDQAVNTYHTQADRPWHHALHDAHAHRVGWQAWMDKRRRDNLSQG